MPTAANDWLQASLSPTSLYYLSSSADKSLCTDLSHVSLGGALCLVLLHVGPGNYSKHSWEDLAMGWKAYD